MANLDGTIGLDSTDPRVGTTFDHHGYSVRVDVEDDDDTRLSDLDSFNDSALDYWRRDLWRYVGVVVTASRVGVELGRAALWGIERGTFPVVDLDTGELAGERYVGPYREAVEDMIGEAVAEADRVSIELCAPWRDSSTVTLTRGDYMVRVVRHPFGDPDDVQTSYVGPFTDHADAESHAERVEAAAWGRDESGREIVTSAFVEFLTRP